MSMAVAHAYRELGVLSRSREITMKLWEEGSKETKAEAAHLMAYLVEELEEQELWLSRSDQNLAGVKTAIRRTRANRLIREGRFAEADRLLAEVQATYEKDARQSWGETNNAALAAQARYFCTGKRSYLNNHHHRIGSSNAHGARELSHRERSRRGRRPSGGSRGSRRWIDVAALPRDRVRTR